MRLFYGSYEFPRTPAITQEIRYEAEEGENISKRESWTITGSLTPATCGHTQVWALVEALLAAIEQDKETFSIRENDGVTVVYEIEAADCIEGPRFTDHRILEPRKGFLLNNAQYELRLECLKPIEDEDEVSRTLDVNFSYDVFGILTITERGEILYKQENNIASIPTSIFSINTQNWSKQQQFGYSDDKQRVNYTYVYTQKVLAVPPSLDALGVETWNISLSSKETDTGTPEYTISGSCRLRGAGTVALPVDQELSGRDIISPEGMNFSSSDDQVLGSVGATLYGNMEQLAYYIENELLSENVVITDRDLNLDPSTRTVSFSYSYNTPGGGGGGGGTGGGLGVEFSYSWSVSGGEIRVNEVNRFGKPPYIQQMGENAIILSENGTLQSRQAYPPAPEPFGDNVILSDSSVNKTPNFDRAGNAIYQTEFRYSYYYLSRGAPEFAARARELFNTYGKVRRRQEKQYTEEIGRRQIGF